MYTIVHKCVEAMEGGQLFVGRADLQEFCRELACSLIQLNLYRKKSKPLVVGTVRAKATCLNTRITMDYGSKMEAYALKDLLMNS